MLGHAEALVGAASGPRDTFLLTFVPDGLESARRYIEAALADPHAVPFATVDVMSGAVVGSTRFFNIEFWDWPEGNGSQRGRDLPDVLEIGYTWLTPAAQRTAINTEAKLLMLTQAFEGWRVHRVKLATDARTRRS